MIVGVGLDLADVQFWSNVLDDPTTTVIEGTFTAQERMDSERGPVPPAERYAARFAAKEAAIKALAGTRIGEPPLLSQIKPADIEVSRDTWGRPSLHLTGTAKTIADAIGITNIHVSLTHEGVHAAAVVILESRANAMQNSEKK